MTDDACARLELLRHTRPAGLQFGLARQIENNKAPRGVDAGGCGCTWIPVSRVLESGGVILCLRKVLPEHTDAYAGALDGIQRTAAVQLLAPCRGAGSDPTGSPSWQHLDADQALLRWLS